MSWITEQLAKLEAWGSAEKAKLLPALHTAVSEIESLVVNHVSVALLATGAGVEADIQKAKDAGQSLTDKSVLEGIAKNAGIGLVATFKTDSLATLETAAQKLGTALVAAHLDIQPVDASKLNQ